MKTSALLTLACAALISGSAWAQAPAEVTYVEDPAQGMIFNKFENNWFITVDGGVNVLSTKYDSDMQLKHRIAPAADVQLGKWFSPLIGFRGGFTWLNNKGITNGKNVFGIVRPEKDVVATYNTNNDQLRYETCLNQLGVNFDAMLNVTNWLCGYKPNRFYNFVAYVGGVSYWGYQHKNGNDKALDTSVNQNRLGLRGGVINSINLTNALALSLDLRFTGVGSNCNDLGENGRGIIYDNSKNWSAFVGLTYNFGKTTWNAPIVPVCPPAQDCTPIQARLDDAEARLADCQRKLDECLRRPIPAPVVKECIAPITTVYYTIGSSRVSRIDANVLRSVAAQMKADTSKKYDICGWADNYTGSEALNARLRTARANAVKAILIRNGVKADQLNVTTNPGDRYTGKENVYLDRCVTIQAM